MSFKVGTHSPPWTVCVCKYVWCCLLPNTHIFKPYTRPTTLFWASRSAWYVCILHSQWTEHNTPFYGAPHNACSGSLSNADVGLRTPNDGAVKCQERASFNVDRTSWATGFTVAKVTHPARSQNDSTSCCKQKRRYKRGREGEEKKLHCEIWASRSKEQVYCVTRQAQHSHSFCR